MIRNLRSTLSGPEVLLILIKINREDLKVAINKISKKYYRSSISRYLPTALFYLK